MRIAAAGLAGFLALAGGEGDVVVLKNGKSLRGRVVFQDASKLVLRQATRDVPIVRQEIERVDSCLRNLDALLDNAVLAQPFDRDKLELLASQAEEMGLAGETQVFWWRLLLLDRGYEPARRALGHLKRGGAWTIPFEGRVLDWEKRLELAREWGSAWEFSSLHYRLRSNLPLQPSLEALLDLERLYQAFFELFGAELELYDICRPMNVHLHGGPSYPVTAGEFGRYEPSTDIVLVNAAQGLVFPTLAHEATHQLLYDTAFRERNGNGSFPAWLGEGLAEYVAAGVQRSSDLVFDAGRVEARHFRAHARAKLPFELTRLLAFSASDYDVSSDRLLKYAQSYTLVHFLLHGAQAGQRAGFLDYLRTVYRGKGSAADLKRCLKADWRKLEEAWHAYARGMKL